MLKSLDLAVYRAYPHYQVVSAMCAVLSSMHSEFVLLYFAWSRTLKTWENGNVVEAEVEAEVDE